MNILPLIKKFNCNSVLYDSVGEESNNYISFTSQNEYIYFLMQKTGLIYVYNTDTEEISATNIVNSDNEMYSILAYKGGIHGFNGHNVKLFVDDTVLYIKDDNKLIQEYINEGTKIIHLSSYSKITDFFVDDSKNYYVLHGDNKISKFTKERIHLYTFSINPTPDTVFNGLGVMPNDIITLLKIDYVREYTDMGLSAYPIVLGRINNGTEVLSSGQLFLAKIDEINKNVSYAQFIDCVEDYIPYSEYNKINYNLTNYDYLKNKYADSNQLLFKLVLKNVFNNKDLIKVEIPIDISLFKTEYHHFAFRMDGLEGKIDVFCDGKIIKTVEIQKGQYIFQDIFNDSINVGNTYFNNNVSLPEYLNQNNYYFINNCKMKQFKLYKKALTNSEIEFHVFNGIKMNDLVVSLPCDQRNELDGIERQFKLDTTGNKSNKVNIIIKNSKITNSILQEEMKKIIFNKIKKVLPVTITINNIEFR
jgi:hypothetical protein